MTRKPDPAGLEVRTIAPRELTSIERAAFGLPVDVLAVLDAMFAAEAEADSPCEITVRRLKCGTVKARMSFAPGMETVSGEGRTVAEAMTSLAARVGGAA